MGGDPIHLQPPFTSCEQIFSSLGGQSPSFGHVTALFRLCRAIQGPYNGHVMDLIDLPLGVVVLLVFVAQAFFIFLKGLQQINVVAGRRVPAALVSFALGVTGLITLDILANGLVKGTHWLVYVSYLLAGVVGIIMAMYLESRRLRK